MNIELKTNKLHLTLLISGVIAAAFVGAFSGVLIFALLFDVSPR